jgi:tetratricopeptide (TPR) repeat protein
VVPPTPDEQLRLDRLRVRLFGTAPGAVRIGRYLIIERIGAGGMGEVYCAYDPEIDRKVAVKLTVAARSVGPAAQQGLRDEARAMARVHDPHVAAVYDVGVWEQRTFVAMELCDGVALPSWLARPRTWREIVDVLSQAGRGLSAAHAAGLVHHDFKPGNVMVGDGGVKVLDFGLARAIGAPVGDDPAGPSFSGTPGYAAPELLHGPADTRSDQYSFCATLHEALFGALPAGGRADAGSRDRDGRPEPVPAWLRAAVDRGLATDPQRRFPDMDALLRALDHRGRRRRRWVVALAALAGGLALALGLSLGRRPDAPACRPDPDLLAGVWDAAARGRVETAILGAGRSYGTDNWARLSRRLDDYARAWLDARVAACEATHVRHEQSGRLLDLRIACLDEHRARLATLVDLLAEGDPATTQRALSAAARLPAVEACSDAKTLEARAPLVADPAVAAAAAGLQLELARATALEDAGRYPQGLDLAQSVLAQAIELDVPAVEAMARYRLGNLLDANGRSSDGVAELQRAGELAIAAGDDGLAARAFTDAMHVLADVLDQHDEALALQPAVAGLLKRAGDPAAGQARLLNTLGVIRYRQGRNDEALRLLGDSLDLLADVLAPADPRLAGAFDNLGLTLSDLGRHADAERAHRRAVELFEGSLGPHHPELAIAVDNLGVALRRRGAYEQAGDAHRRALAIKVAALGDRHPSVAASRHNLATVLYRLAEPEAALEEYAAAAAIWSETVGPQSRQVAGVLTNRGMVLRELGRFDEARGELTRALELKAELFGDSHASLASTLDLLGRTWRDLGDPRQALPLHERALAIAESANGPAHASVAEVLAAMAWTKADLGHRAEAVSMLRRALQIYDASDAPPGDRGAARFDLAQLLADGPAPNRAEAIELARRAVDELRGTGPRGERKVEEIERWLAGRP